jgi:hypothetical protein
MRVAGRAAARSQVTPSAPGAAAVNMCQVWQFGLSFLYYVTKVAKRLAMTQHDSGLIFFTTHIRNDFARARQIGIPEAFELLDIAC